MFPQNYLDLPAELSGSEAKNRFRWEMLWGLHRIFEIYDDTDDFTVIFDYVCDVEIHTPNDSSYYQIKTKRATKPYTLKDICKTDTNQKTGEIIHSILGKLYLIKHKSDRTKKAYVAIVADVGLSHKQKEYTNKLELHLCDLDDDATETVISKLEKEFPGTEIDLKDILFIRSFMDLAHPENTIRGEIVKWFPVHKGSEVKNPNALYQTLSDLVRDKASFEWKVGTLEELTANKGITKDNFDRIIELHTQKAADGIELSKQWIKDNYRQYKTKLNALSDLSTVVEYRSRDARLLPIIALIEELVHANETPDDLNTKEIIAFIYNRIKKLMPPDYSSTQAEMLILVTLKRLEEEACL